jgi:hypothetical protein
MKNEQPTNQDIIDTFEKQFHVENEDRKYIDITRIPLICQDIKDMKNDIANINDNLKWAVRIVIGAVIVGLIGLLSK